MKLKFPKWLPKDYRKKYKYITFGSVNDKPRFYGLEPKPPEKKIVVSSSEKVIKTWDRYGVQLNDILAQVVNDGSEYWIDCSLDDDSLRLTSHTRTVGENPKFEKEWKRYESDSKIYDKEKEILSDIEKIFNKWREQENIKDKLSHFKYLKKELTKAGVKL